MLLDTFTGDHYKSIENSSEVKVHKKITRFVGQNEAGKTALLELLNVLRPISQASQRKFDLEDYPRKKLNAYKKTHEADPHTPIKATFILNPDEVNQVESKFGKGVLKSTSVTLSKNYDNETLFFTLLVNEDAYIQNFLSKITLDDTVSGVLKNSRTVKDLKLEISKLSEEQKALFKGLSDDLSQDIYKSLDVPYFFYFDDYATLPGEISLKKLQQFIKWKRRPGGPMFWARWRSHVGHQWRFGTGPEVGGCEAASVLDETRRTDAAPVSLTG